MNEPLVSVLTPVYNGELFLAECIESVLAQKYRNWEYVIVNNRSTDRTLEIAKSYAEKDRRIRISTNNVFVGGIENHNNAFRLRSASSKYCKVLSADDWLMPDCLTKMVSLAEEHPRVGIVGAYQRSGETLRWRALPTTVRVLPGRDACRLCLLDRKFLFGAPTAFLYRSDLESPGKPFFPHLRSHADTSVCYEYLREREFGFVHEVLSAERLHPGQWSSEMDALGAGSVAYLEVLMEYGPWYLSEAEFASRREQVLEEYYQGLGRYALRLKNRKFWSFNAARLREIGLKLDWPRVLAAALWKALEEIRHPKTAVRKIEILMKQGAAGPNSH
jgi:glycosyltransferase involved in cell wall biosynthesis